MMKASIYQLFLAPCFLYFVMGVCSKTGVYVAGQVSQVLFCLLNPNSRDDYLAVFVRKCSHLYNDLGCDLVLYWNIRSGHTLQDGSS